MTASDKFKSREEVSQILNLLKNKGSKIVLTNGCFDILHKGHLSYLEEAKSLGDILVVAVNTNESVRSFKAPERPFNDERDRAFLIAGLECVDFVFLFKERLPIRNIEVCQPDIFVKGGDYTIETLPEAQTVIAHKGKVEILTLEDSYSTTSLVEKIRNI